MTRRLLLVTVTVAALVVLLTKGQGTMPVSTDAVSAVSAQELSVAARARVFFGHQSVGQNVLDGVEGVYAAHGRPTPATWSDVYLGENGDPLSKLEEFDARLREGLGDEVDVAFMKLCYVDVTRDTDVEAVFDQYRRTLADLERDFPEVRFLHVTTPLTTEAGLVAGLKSRVKAVLGRDVVDRPADNAARERYNALLREEYAADRVFDLAGIESTAPDGTRVSGEDDGQEYFALYSGYAADSGHLGPEASAMVAARLLELVARSSGV